MQVPEKEYVPGISVANIGVAEHKQPDCIRGMVLSLMRKSSKSFIIQQCQG